LKIENVVLKNGAVIIADVHYKKGDDDFLNLLKTWNKNPPSQIFLLGDIFHLLLPFDYLIKYNQEAISLINSLSQKTEIYYTPGNHDFNIRNIFPKILFAQAFFDKEKSIFLTHGDLTDDDVLYHIYEKIIRCNFIENLFHIITLNFINNWLFKKILQKKIECKKIKNFKNKIKQKIKEYNYDIIIEGHYHQNVILHFNDKQYINLPAFVCNKNYFLIQLENNPIIKEIKYDGR